MEGTPHTPQALPHPAETAPEAGSDMALTVTLVVIFAAVAALILLVAYLRFPLDLAGGSLTGSDSYYWMVTFREYLETGIWHNDVIERSNAPFGEPWFRPHPFHMVLLAIFWPLNLFLGVETSLHITGVVVAPILGIALCVSAMWAGAPLLGRHRYWIMPMLFLQYPVLGQVLPGLVDHHTLMHLILVIALGLVIRALTAANKLAYAFAAGLVHGFGLWVSVEMFALLIMTYACGAVLWLLAPRLDHEAPPVSQWHVWFGFGFILLVAVAVLIEQPSGRLLAAEYDRVSIVHMLMAALALGAWMIVDQLERRRLVPPGLIRRSMILAVAGGVALAIMHIAYPKFFLGPLAEVDPALRALLVDVTSEMVPIYRHSPMIILGQLGLNLVALPLAIWIAVRERKDWRLTSSWVFVAAGLALFAALLLLYVRFSAYVSCLAVFPLAYALGKTIDYSRANLGFASGIAVRAVTILLLVSGAGTLPISVATSGENPLVACQYKDIAPFLNRLDGTKTILAGVHDGPELLYLTRHSVVGTPYHRNAAGVKDTHLVMSDRTDTVAQSIVESRGIDLILLCSERPFDTYGSGSLYRRLMDKVPPAWLRPVPLPDSIADKFNLYEVIM
jgi:hypothetical protein